MRLALLAAVAMTAAGCGESGPTPLPPAPVAVVTLDGKPVAGLTLRLHTTDGSAVGAGSTGPDGRTDLRGPNGQPVPAGTYKVTVEDQGESEDNPMAVAKAKPKSRVPVAFAKPTGTPLGLTIEAGRMEYPVDLKSKL